MAIWLIVMHYGSWNGTIAHGMVLLALWFMEWHYGSWYISLVQDHVHGIALLVGHYVSWYETVICHANVKRSTYTLEKRLYYIVFYKMLTLGIQGDFNADSCRVD